MNNSPSDVLEYQKTAPNFRRVNEEKICYFCANNKYGMWDESQSCGVFYCTMHNFPFGRIDQVTLQVEFTCDDWKSIEEGK